MGAGKTKQTIDAAQELFCRGVIDRVAVIAPGPVRDVWYDQERGQLTKHLWKGLYSDVFQYRQKITSWEHEKQDSPALSWIITNYEFIRRADRLKTFLKYLHKGTLLVCDESSSIKNYKSLQSMAVQTIRMKCGRVLLLNGTPVTLHPGDMFGQGFVMDKQILGCRSFFHFRSKYAIMGGWNGRAIAGWRDLEDIQRRFAPFVLRRLKKDVLPDLPPKLEPITLTATLNSDTWMMYKEMRDEMVAWLTHTVVSVSPQAVTKSLRLSQMTSGFLGGLREAPEAEIEGVDDRPDWLPAIENARSDTLKPSDNIIVVDDVEELQALPPQEVGREKLDVALSWINERLYEDPCFKLLIWGRFIPELRRLRFELEKLQHESSLDLQLGYIMGGQKQEDRKWALDLLDPDACPKDKPVIVAGTSQTGSMGLNLAASHTVLRMSWSTDLKIFLQADDRVHRPGQTFAGGVSYYDIIAVGPQGQKTVDHGTLLNLREKKDLSKLTTKEWESMLEE